MQDTALTTLLDQLKDMSFSKRDQGERFERLISDLLSNDKIYAPQFTQVTAFVQWAQAKGEKGNDIGIDLVAKNADDDKYTAIQCKFYDEESSISKKGIDSFIAASDRPEFNRRIFVDTTKKGITENLQRQLDKSEKTFTRIGRNDLENSSIDWDRYLADSTKVKQRTKKILRPHQRDALNAVKRGLATADRGKMIMACGTGKTYAALKIAEDLAGENKSVLFLVPSLSLMSQSITEWSIETDIALRTLAVCSDTQVGKRKAKNDDDAEISIHDLAYPATTNAKKLAEEIHRRHELRMTVVFATYQSLDVIAEAQKNHELSEFDLIICDEAHRTTGATLADQEESSFVKVHNQGEIKGSKRLYMTATPRVYVTKIKKAAEDSDATLYSMDDETKFGKELYVMKFGEAVEQKLLSDYKVLILTIDEKEAASIAAAATKDSQPDSDSFELDSTAKIIGCYKALVKEGVKDTEGDQPMKRAVAFCRNINLSKQYAENFQPVVNALAQQNKANNEQKQYLQCEVRHIDGTMNTAKRDAELNWLRETVEDNQCCVLSNARCLSEGVDVPSLDAVLFVHSRKSKVDIVQSVGRVMRRAEGKKLGYVILPILIPANVEPDVALQNNKNYEIVWDVLNALRSHDERLDAKINVAALEGTWPESIEVVATVKNLPSKKAPSNGDGNGNGNGGGNGEGNGEGNGGGNGEGNGEGNGGGNGEGNGEGNGDDDSPKPPRQKEIDLDATQKAILAKIVQKCGSRIYWENWSKSIADIARKQIVRINATLSDTNSKQYKSFADFLSELQSNINKTITHDDLVEMLAQHSITLPVFEALFEESIHFVVENPVSKSMGKVFDLIVKEGKIADEAQSLQRFYDSIKRRADGIETAQGKQKVITELYDNFFRTAFPKMSERLGIVYTPVECVDFIIHSVNHALKQEFDQSLADENVHIIDPFTGTGTFITRLMQSELIPTEKLAHKYKNELHANEIVLLAYYIASVNIESVFHSIVRDEYQLFEGICLTDTFQLYEQKEDLITPQLPVNSSRLNRQKQLEIKVIIGNPPYSVGQGSGNDNNQNLSYTKLDAQIDKHYVRKSKATLFTSVYDSYIRAIRWASDRIGDVGVIGFITNAGWIESNATDGMRKALQEEFSNIYIFHLRGNQRTSGELSRKEGGKIFGGGSRAPIALSILIKNPQAKSQGKINFYDIGDYLSSEQKLARIKDLASIEGISKADLWQAITPDKYNDWVNQRDDSFYNHIPLGDKKIKEEKKVRIFRNYSNGIATSRDAWVYNFSRTALERKIKSTIDFYNQELDRYNNSPEKSQQPTNKQVAEKYIASCVTNDSTRIAFSRDFRYDIFDDTRKQYHDVICRALYRPFTRTNAYYHGSIMMELYQMPKIFPQAGLDNLVIGVSSRGAKSFSAFISDVLQDLHVLESGTQCFPMYLYEVDTSENLEKGQIKDKFQQGEIVAAASGKKYRRNDAITDKGLAHFTDYYKDTNISKEDLFYYIYGLLHSPDYRKRFAPNLAKDLPHIPIVASKEDFWIFSQAGINLADLHLNYESQVPYKVDYAQSQTKIDQLNDADFYVRKMKFAKKLHTEGNKKEDDKSTIIYNDKITITGIPEEAYDYVVNAKSAIEWVMERQGVSTHKASGITNDANDWAKETMNNPKYPFELLLKVITTSIKTVKIVKSLPTLSIAATQNSKANN